MDESADIDDAAEMIAKAKTFDFASSCLADNAVVVEQSIYPHLLAVLQQKGAYLCDESEKKQLQAVMWPKADVHIPALDVVAKSAAHIASQAGFKIPADRQFLIVEEQGAGPDYPFSGEKLSVVLATYRYEGEIANAIKLVNAITAYQGQGHTCGIHTTNQQHLMQLALNTRTSRVLHNQSLNEGAGSPRKGLPYTLSLSCGSWGGNITSENINARHFINTTWVSSPVPMRIIDEQVLFENYLNQYEH